MTESDRVLEVLIELTRTFTADLAIEDVLKGVTDASLELLPGTHASLRVLNDTQDELINSARSGDGASAKPMTFRRGEGIAGWVAEYGRPACIDDTREDKRFKDGGRAQGFAIRSIAAVPLVLAEQVIGVMAVTSPQVRAFTKRHITLMQLLCNCCVPILERARRQSIAAVDEVTRAHSATTLVPQLAKIVGRSRRTGARAALLLFDLDALHRVYKEHSFETGDHVLRQFAARVRQMQPADGWLVRRGGGGFALIAQDADQAAASQLAESLRRDVAVRPIAALDGAPMELTVSVGATSLQGDESAEHWLQRAEAALSAAQRAGGDQIAVGDPATDAP